MLYNAFQSGRHPQKCPFQWGHLLPHVIHVPWTHLTQYSKQHLDRFDHFNGALGRVHILYSVHKIAINVI